MIILLRELSVDYKGQIRKDEQLGIKLESNLSGINENSLSS